MNCCGEERDMNPKGLNANAFGPDDHTIVFINGVIILIPLISILSMHVQQHNRIMIVYIVY